MKIAHLLPLAAVLAGAAASATPAQAAQDTRHGGACSEEPGYMVGRDQDGIHSVPPSFAYIYCFNNSDQTRNVSRVEVRMFASNPNDTNLCVVWGDRDGVRTFEPLVVKTEVTGESVIGIDIPFNNDTKLVTFHCYLPAPDVGPQYLMDYTVFTR